VRIDSGGTHTATAAPAGRATSRSGTERGFRRALFASSVVVVVFVLWMELEIGGPSLTEAFSDIVQSIVPLAAAGACFHAARRTPYGFGRAWTASLRRSWRLLGAACLSWGLGQVVWTYYEVIAKTDPFPSLADLGFLCTVPLLVAGVMAFPTGASASATARLRTLLDGLLIAVSLLFLSWATVLGGAYRGANSSGLEKAFALAYPLGDICAATIALVVLSRSRGRGVAHLSLIAAAILALAVSDSAFAYMTQTGSYSSSALVNTGWLVGWLLFLATALRPAVAELRRGDDEEVPSLSRLALPYVPLLLAAVTGVAVQLIKGKFEPFLVFAGTAVGLLVIGRQVVALIENRLLNARLQTTVLQLAEQEQKLKDALRREQDTLARMRATDDMKDTFLRAVSHDLRTPLTAMLGVAVTLERTKLNLPREQALDLIRMLVEKTQKLERLLKDLLDLNRLEEGVLEPNRSLTDVRELVHRVVTEIDQLAGWPIDIEAEPIMAFIDGPKVERIVENLLLNTTRHTPPGTRVWVRAHARGGDLELIVEDAGPGVPAELVGTIFEAFRRGGAAAPTAAHSRGVGIGLSLVARFAQLHGGHAWVDERWGGGAAFHVLLPNTVSYERGYAQVLDPL
jgi:signal transduction histidine kinase